MNCAKFKMDDFMKNRLMLVFIFAVFLQISVAENPPTGRPSVTTSKGPVQGVYIESKATAGKYMSVFKGIPYAKPPIGDLRFRDPVSVGNWTEPKNLSETEPNACPQPSLGRIQADKFITDEDCLYINVYAPYTSQPVNSSNLLPVMVWIYGGAFVVGTSAASMYGPDHLVDKDVVFVSLNYRVGVMGFLNLGTDAVPGNAGLKDQVLALQWVQTEISKFGGDPEKVTLFGESAGAASVSLLYLAPKTEKLFRYAIAESGNALARWPFLETGFLERAKLFSAGLNCPVVNDTVPLSCLQNATVADVIAKQSIELDANNVGGPGLPFVPSVEKASSAALLSDTPNNLLNNLLASTRTKRLIITGINKDEGILQLSTDETAYTRLYSNLQTFISEETRAKKSEVQITNDVASIKAEYFNNTAPSTTNLDGYIKIYTDQLFALSTAMFARRMANSGNVYLYSFEFMGDYGLMKPTVANLTVSGVGHADELGYLFTRSNLNQSADGPSRTTLTRMVTMWTNFAKYGNPTPNQTENSLPFTWYPVSEGNSHYLQITEQPAMSSANFKEEAVTFWNKIESVNDRPSVVTTKGEVIGYLMASRSTPNKNMKVFKGIPYAKPPVKDLRFKDPLPAEGWTKPMDLSQQDPISCPQPSRTSRTQETFSEDCLFISVFAPQAANSSNLLPVIVWTYGGAFIAGGTDSSIYGPDFLVDQDVVFVMMNYRVGVLGFLNLGTNDVPGNAGLKDQLLALQWVQTEINRFGGDPNKVTLFGESAGAASVSLNYLSPKSANLFQYAIADSGNALAKWPFLESGFLERAKTFSINLNCSLLNDIVQLTCLQNASINDVVLMQMIQLNENQNEVGYGLSPFVPSLEKASSVAVLSDTPANLLANMVKSGNTRPIITGINKDEGIFQLMSPNASYYIQLYNTLQYFIPEKSRNAMTQSQIESAVAAVKARYFNSTEPTLNNLDGVIKIYTDKLFALSNAEFARQTAKTGKTYLYSFEFNGDFKRSKTSLNISGVSHGDELGYIFLNSNLNQTTTTEDSPSKITLRRMVKMWTNFAKYGTPTPGNTSDSDLQNFIWSPVSDGSYHYMRVTAQLAMSSENFKEDELAFWNKIESTSFGTKLSCSFVIVSVVIGLRVLF